ncbi:MAG: SurA N-terminal domain-containing protein [Candidatus Omnitrophica bacterium]|nr:SurA N-terminal domain-containing protein [Candidatus Omnitrophota bacterium]
MKMLFCCILISSFILTGCSSAGTEGDNRIVTQVNKYKMTVEDLKYELRNIPYDDVRLLNTEEGRREYMDRLLEKEILLQEAQRQGLDREKDFMRSIENYWEQALLRLLLEKKSSQISGAIRVYDREVEEYYRASGEQLPFSRVEADIRRGIRQKKETEAMDNWVKELREKSYIKINDRILKEVLSSK